MGGDDGEEAEGSEASDPARRGLLTMPAKSEKQRRLMAAALHGSDNPKARAIRQSMSREQIQEFVGGEPVNVSYRYNFRSRNNLKRGPHR